jgi:hypothetical protein
MKRRQLSIKRRHPLEARHEPSPMHSIHDNVLFIQTPNCEIVLYSTIFCMSRIRMSHTCVIEPMREARFGTPLLQCSLGMPWSIKHIVAQLVLSILQPDNFCFIALPIKSIDVLECFLSFSDEVEDSPLARLPTAVPPRLSSSGL